MLHTEILEDQQVLCSDCGMDLGVDLVHAYLGSAGVQLCWECALARGGAFDERRERWNPPPDISDLPDERRVHH
jgi:hypothetical protein